jgi:hypothetical protein
MALEPLFVEAILREGQTMKRRFVFAQSGQSRLEFMSLPSAASPGQKIMISVHTLPRVQCKIEAQEESLAQALALGEKTADNAGKASWTFKVSETYKANKMPIIVTGKCAKGETKSISAIPINRSM